MKEPGAQNEGRRGHETATFDLDGSKFSEFMSANLAEEGDRFLTEGLGVPKIAERYLTDRM